MATIVEHALCTQPVTLIRIADLLRNCCGMHIVSPIAGCRFVAELLRNCCRKGMFSERNPQQIRKKAESLPQFEWKKKQRCANVRMCRCADVQMCGCADVQMCRCADVRMCVCANVQMCKCANVRMKKYRLNWFTHESESSLRRLRIYWVSNVQIAMNNSGWKFLHSSQASNYDKPKRFFILMAEAY
jgi:hypothetical protein